MAPQLTKVALTKRNYDNLMNGKPCLLKHEQLGEGETTLKLGAAKHKRLQKAMLTGKGIKLQLEPEEWSVQGGKLSWKGFKRFYKKNVAPIVRSGLKKGLKAAAVAVPTMLGVPQAAPFTSFLANAAGDKAIDAIGDATGGFGARRPAPSVVLESNYSNFLNHRHPAMRPGLPPLPDFSQPRVIIRGGSFLAAGRGRNRSPLHPASNPTPEWEDNSVIRF